MQKLNKYSSKSSKGRILNVDQNKELLDLYNDYHLVPDNTEIKKLTHYQQKIPNEDNIFLAMLKTISFDK